MGNSRQGYCFVVGLIHRTVIKPRAIQTLRTLRSSFLRVLLFVRPARAHDEANIGAWTFGTCTSLTSVAIPNSVTSIEQYVFSNCSSLISVAIPSSVASIESAAFQFCSNLASITIPGTIRDIGNSAFSHCSSLTSAYFQGNAPTIGVNVFFSAKSEFKVYRKSWATGFTNPWNGYPVSTY